MRYETPLSLHCSLEANWHNVIVLLFLWDIKSNPESTSGDYEAPNPTSSVALPSNLQDLRNGVGRHALEKLLGFRVSHLETLLDEAVDAPERNVQPTDQKRACNIQHRANECYNEREEANQYATDKEKWVPLPAGDELRGVAASVKQRQLPVEGIHLVRGDIRDEMVNIRLGSGHGRVRISLGGSCILFGVRRDMGHVSLILILPEFAMHS